jgi:methyl-accepting chemotaxis protein
MLLVILDTVRARHWQESVHHHAVVPFAMYCAQNNSRPSITDSRSRAHTDYKIKKMKLNNLKIGQRLGLGFSLMVALLVLVAATGLANMASLNTLMRHVVDENNVKLTAATDMRDAQRRVSQGVRDVILTSDEAGITRELAAVDAAGKDYDRALKILEGLVKRQDAKDILQKIGDTRATAAPLIAAAEQLGKENKDDEAFAMLKTKVMPAVAAWQDAIGKMVELQAARNEEDQATGLARYEQARMLLWSVTGLSAVFAVAVGWLFTRSITQPMRQAVAIAKTVAAGDLTSRIKVDSSDETGELLGALKAMNDSLCTIVNQVRGGTQTLATATNEIAMGNLDLSSRTEQQASALEETASSMEELTSTVKQNAENARQANQLALSASEVAVRGGTVVADVVTTMGSINESANRIVDIISVIDGIAFQTNILALNAAVEAARAGEQGRGFAVVASEVRNLAQRSASAAKEIKSLIDDSVGKVNEGNRLVHEAGSTMNDVVVSVRRVTDIIGEITAASHEQEAGIEQINQAVGEMDAVTQQNAALVEEAAAAAQSLQTQSSQLEQMVSTFRLADEARTTMPVAKPRVAAAAGRPAARPALAAVGDWETF